MPPAHNSLARHSPTLREALDNILPKTKPESVHKLRAILRRILAELSLLPDAPETAKQIARFTRLTKPIIKAAGNTRDLDVHLDLLEKLPHNLQPEIDSLARHLLKKRRRRAATLLQLVRRDQKELFNAFNQLQAISPDEATPTPVSSSARWTPSSSARTLARDTFSHATNTLDPSQPGQLHELRKAARNARYLAESAPKATRTAAHFRYIQQSIGAWHDYLTLAESAHRYLPTSSPLIPTIERLRDRHHRTALKSLAVTGQQQPVQPSHHVVQRSAELPGPAADIFYKR